MVNSEMMETVGITNYREKQKVKIATRDISSVESGFPR